MTIPCPLSEVILLRIGLAIATMEELPEIKRKKRIRELFKMAADLGYDGVELHISNPSKVDTSFLKDLSATHGLDIPAIGTGPTYVHYRISFLNNPRVRRRALDRLRKYVEVARDLEAIVIIGLIRGRLAEGRFTLPRAWQIIRDCLASSARVAEDHGVVLALEPINRYETELINTVAEALKMTSAVNSENVKIMADTFHMNIEEVTIEGALQQAGGELVHFHVADSNRLAPGKGHLDFARIISELSEIGYDRYASAEILLKPSVKQAFLDTVQCLKPLLTTQS